MAEAASIYKLSEEEFQTLSEKAIEAKAKAYCPYSNFRVGACVLIAPAPQPTHASTQARQLYFSGSNVENVSTPVGTCAERCALAALIASFSRPYLPTIRAIAVASDVSPPATPCGMCRQFMAEFSAQETPVYMFGEEGGPESHFVIKTVGELLPWGFKRETPE